MNSTEYQTDRREIEFVILESLKAGKLCELPDFSDSNPDNDIVFTWNGTTAGVRIKNTDFSKPESIGNTNWTRHPLKLERRLDYYYKKHV